MKTIFFLLTLCISAAAQVNNDHGVHFQPEGTRLQTLLDQGRKENKLIFIDAYTSWCGPCKWMDKNVFTTQEVGNYFNEHFINAKFNMEQGEGIELRKKFKVMAYPTFLFLDANGEVVHRICGSSPKDAFLEKAKVAFDDEKNLKSFVTKYNSGNREVSFLRQYLELGASTCMEMSTEANQFWPAMDKRQWIAEENWSLFTTYVRDFDSDQFQYLVSNFEEATANDKYSAEVEAYAHEVMYHALMQPMIKKDDQLLAFNRQKIGQLNIAPAKRALILTTLAQQEKSKDWKNYFSEGEKYIATFGFDKPERINTFAWTLHQNTDDKALLSDAAAWMEQMLRDEQNRKYLYLETYASLLRKSGNLVKGDSVAAEAIALAESRGENYKVEREIREAKAALRNDLEQIRLDIEQAMKEGDTEKAAKLERARQDRIGAHNEKITKLLGGGE